MKIFDSMGNEIEIGDNILYYSSSKNKLQRALVRNIIKCGRDEYSYADLKLLTKDRKIRLYSENKDCANNIVFPRVISLETTFKCKG